MNTKISIITIHYNNTLDTIHFLQSLQGLNRDTVEVIIVDNGSVNEIKSFINMQFPWVKIIRSIKNLGFAGGNNLGISHAKGEYLFFVNNDTVFYQPIYFKLAEVLKNDNQIAFVSPVLLNSDGTIQYRGFTPIHALTGRNKSMIEKGAMYTPLNNIIKTYSPHGAAMMIRKEVLHKIGFMPENYFLYYEELEWASNALKLGYKNVVDQSVFIVHNESKTTGSISDLKAYFISRNRILFMRSNYSGMKYLIFIVYFMLIAFPYHFIKLIYLRKKSVLLAYLAGIYWNFTHTIHETKLGYKFNYLQP